MNDEKEFIGRVRRELDGQVEGQAASLQGRICAARREALDGVTPAAISHRWMRALAASLFVVVAVSALWFDAARSPDVALESLLQTATIADQKILHEGDEIEFYQDLEFYYWLQQEQANAG